MASGGTKAKICDFPHCSNTPERAKSRGRPFGLNRIPINSALVQKWTLVFNQDLSSRVGQSLSICNLHYNNETHRLVLPRPGLVVAKPSKRRGPLPRYSLPKTLTKEESEDSTEEIEAPESQPQDQVAIPEFAEEVEIPSQKRKAAEVSLRHIQEHAEELVEGFEGSNSEGSWKPEEGDSDYEAEYLENPDHEETPKTTQDPRHNKPWWGSDSEGEDFLAKDPEPIEVEPQDEVRVEAQEQPTKLERLDCFFQKVFFRPIEEALVETESPGLDRALKCNDLDYLEKKKRQIKTQLEIVAHRNDLLERQIVIKQNKLKLYSRTLGLSNAHKNQFSKIKV